jgi:hypothetical protein
MADTKDCYLIPEENRTFVVPRAPKAGKGRGMGQSQVWYADSNYAQEEFIPKVMEYIDSAREEFKSMDFFYDGILEKAEDHGESTEALIDKCREILQDEKREWIESFRFVNLAVEKDDCYKTRFLRAQLYRDIAAYDEAEEEYKNSLYHEETIEALADLMFVEILLNHTFLAIELGEKIRKRKSEDDYWTDNANNLAFLYIDEGEFDEARLLIEECEGEEDTKHSWTDKARKYLKEQMKAAKCVE